MGRKSEHAVSKFFVLAALMVLVGMTGCAEKGPILLAITYQAPTDKTVLSKNAAVAVSPFIDSRVVNGSVLGRRTVSNGMENDLVTQGSVADLVTSKLKTALQARGAAVKNSGDWNLTAEGMPSNGARIVISGEIKSFWIDSVSVPFKTTMKTNVQLKVVVGDTTEKKILRILDVNSKVEQEVLYSEEKLNSVMSEALSAALDQIFKDDIVKQKLQ